MKFTRSEEAARFYLNAYRDVHSLPQLWTLFNKKHRLWINDSDKTFLIHICAPRKVLHKVEYSKPFDDTDLIVGHVQDGSFWHTNELAYRCDGCHTKFTGSIAFIIKIGIQEKDKLTS